MRNLTQFIVLLLVLLAVPASLSAGETASVEDMLRPRVLGAEDAPVTMIEYSSFTCPHCAAFHLETLPKLKEAYIDTGKLRVEFHDFPLDVVALAATMLTRCASEDRYFDFVDKLFRKQREWALGDPRSGLLAMAEAEGMTEEDFRQCLSNSPLRAGLMEAYTEAVQKHGIDSTPTLIIGDETVHGAAPYESFVEVIDRQLKATKASTGTAAPDAPAGGPTTTAPPAETAEPASAEAPADATPAKAESPQ